MRQTDANRTGPHVAAQVASSWASLDAANRSSDLADALSSQDRAFMAAMREMQVVRDFVGTPENILGSETTKHGEIAEQVNVAIIRARDILLGRAPTATFEGVGRFAPTDYRVDGVDIQSKYHNGLRSTLDGVLGHASDHPGFASGGGGYHIPRDQYDQIKRLNQTGRIDGLSDRSADSIRDRLDLLQQRTGRPSDDLIALGRDGLRGGPAGSYSRHHSRPRRKTRWRRMMISSGGRRLTTVHHRRAWGRPRRSAPQSGAAAALLRESGSSNGRARTRSGETSRPGTGWTSECPPPRERVAARSQEGHCTS